MPERNHNLPTPAEAEALNKLRRFADRHESRYPNDQLAFMEFLFQLDGFCVRAVEGLMRKFPHQTVFEARGPLYRYDASCSETLPAWKRACAGVIPKIDPTTARASLVIPRGTDFACAEISLCAQGHKKFALRHHRGPLETGPFSHAEVDMGCRLASTYLGSVDGYAHFRDGEYILEGAEPGDELLPSALEPEEQTIYKTYDVGGLVAGALVDGVRQLADCANAPS